MEFDEMEFLEILHKFESSSISSLIELRQTQFRQATTVITEIKERFFQMRNEFRNALQQLKLDNEDLTKKVEQSKEIVQGKELEILGLRYQLRSMLVSKPTCSICSQKMIVPEKSVSKTQLQLIEQCCEEQENLPTRETKPGDKLEPAIFGRKRSLINASITTSVDSDSRSTALTQRPLPFPMSRRPSQKRRCLMEYNGRSLLQPKTLKLSPYFARRSGDLKTPERNRKCQDEVSTPTNQTLTDGDVSIQSAPTLTMADNSPASFARPIGLTSFSPPTQSFDASLAIHRAVNHSDLVERTYQAGEFRPQRRNINNSHRRGTMRGFCNMKHVHKPTCRHFKWKSAHKSFLLNTVTSADSDVTGADVTLPSDLVVSVSKCVDNKFKKDNQVAASEKKNNAIDVNQDLPSIGGSPTKETYLSALKMQANASKQLTPTAKNESHKMEKPIRNLRKRIN